MKNKVLMSMGIGIAAAMLPVAGAHAEVLPTDGSVTINDADNDNSNGIDSVTVDGETIEMGEGSKGEDGSITQKGEDGTKFTTNTIDHVDNKDEYEETSEDTEGAVLLQEKTFELEVGKVTKDEWDEVIHHDAVTHEEDEVVVDQEAYWEEGEYHEAVTHTEKRTIVDVEAWDEPVHHDAITHDETVTIIDEEAWDEPVHHDAVTRQETRTVIVTPEHDEEVVHEEKSHVVSEAKSFEKYGISESEMNDLLSKLKGVLDEEHPEMSGYAESEVTYGLDEEATSNNDWSVWSSVKPSNYDELEARGLAKSKKIHLDSGLNVEIYFGDKLLDLGQFGIITKELDVRQDMESNFLVFGNVSANGHKIGSTQPVNPENIKWKDDNAFNKDEAGICSHSYYTGDIDSYKLSHESELFENTIDKLPNEGDKSNEALYNEVVSALQWVADSYEQVVHLKASDFKNILNINTLAGYAHVIVDCSDATDDVIEFGEYNIFNASDKENPYKKVEEGEKSINPQQIVWDFGSYAGYIRLRNFSGVCLASNATVDLIDKCEGQVICNKLTNSEGVWHATSCNFSGNETRVYSTKALYKVVANHDEERVVDEEGWTELVHHDAVTREEEYTVVVREAYDEIIHHEAITHEKTITKVLKEAWDEIVHHEAVTHDIDEVVIDVPGYRVGDIYHDAVTHKVKKTVVDKEAWDEIIHHKSEKTPVMYNWAEKVYGLLIETPDTPDTPDIPDIPNTPDNPDTPNTPDNPDTPDTPPTPPVVPPTPPVVPPTPPTPPTVPPTTPGNPPTIVEIEEPEVPLAGQVGERRSRGQVLGAKRAVDASKRNRGQVLGSKRSRNEVLGARRTPGTADANSLAQWISMFGASSGSLAAWAFRNKKRKKDEE